jgi:hypothetical protein
VPHSDQSHLSLIKGGRLTPARFKQLSLADQLASFAHLDSDDQLSIILSAPNAGQLVAALPVQQFYQLLDEAGEERNQPLLQLATPAQAAFIFDLECWVAFDFSLDKAVEWLEQLLATGEGHALRVFRELDPEFLILFLKQTIAVAGGLGDLLTDEERLDAWDHTFDNCYYLKVVHDRHGQLALRLVDLLYRNDERLYVELMEGVKSELASELEELCHQFRDSRLADEGFPPLAEARAVYARVDPAGYRPATDKALADADQPVPPLPALIGDRPTLLLRALAGIDSPALRQELQYLLNTVLVADGRNPADWEGIATVSERVAGCLNIALEYLSGGDEPAARALLTGDYLKRLFQLGHSLQMALHEKARGIESSDYASSRALAGLKELRPRFYRALDPDGVDGYREFRELADIRVMEEFLGRFA